MAITRQQKEEMLAELKDRFEKAKSVIFADYRGLSVKEITELRARLRENKIDYKVAKKTLVKMAAREAGLQELPDGIMEGPLSAAFSYEDEIIGAKTLYAFARNHSALEFLGGVMDGKILTKEKVLELAKLPTREELLAKFVGSLQSPIYGFYGVLSGVMRGLVCVLNGLKEQKESVSN